MLLALVGALVAFAATRRGHSVESVDVRTYVEMTRGISLHGLPYLENGPVEKFPALLVPWNILRDGHYWGVYGVLYPYFAAPFLLAGGLRLMSVATYALTVPIALTTFCIARRVLESERRAVLAAAIATGSTPLLSKSIELSAYPLVVLMAVLAVHVTLITIESRRPLAWSFLAGALFALAAEAHLLNVPLGATLLAVLATCDLTRTARAPAFLGTSVVGSFWPSRRTILSASVALGGELLFLAPASALNRLRFGTLNPFTYGPTPWRGSTDNGVVDQTMGGHLRFAAPVLTVVAAAVLVLLLCALVERPAMRRGFRAGVLVIAVGVLAWHPLLRDRGWALAKAAFAYVFDQSLVPLEPPYRRGAVGLGHLYGQWVTKATLQCTPVFFLVFAVFFDRDLEPRKRLQLTAVLVPCAGLYAYLTLRGNIPLGSALGFPWVYTRYTMPALPMLAIGAVFALRDRSIRWTDAVVAIAVAGAELLWLFGADDDESLARQLVLLALPLAAGTSTLVLVAASRRARRLAPAAMLTAMATLGIGFGQSFGHELRANLAWKSYCDRYSDEIRAHVPERFAVFGYLGDVDPMLAIRAERQVEYADLYQLPDWTQVRGLVDHWHATGMPVYFVSEPRDMQSPWAEIEFRQVGQTRRLWQVTRRAE